MSKVLIFSLLFVFGLKVCANYYTNFSLYGDEAQYWLWSQNLEFGYFSKPPLLAWFLSAHVKFFGDSFFSLKMFPLFIYMLIFYAFYKFCLQLSLSKKASIVCSSSFLLIPAASVSSFLISTDLLLILFWLLSMTKLLETRINASLINFILFGLFLGLAFMAKYAAVYFLLSFFILSFVDKKLLTSLKKNIFKWLFSFFIFLLVLIPNIVWNINNGWVTFIHTSDNANLQNININLYQPFTFLLAQIFMIGPVLFVSFIGFFKSFRIDFENKFLLTFSLPVVLIVLFESFLVRANANWAAPALISLFALFFRHIQKKQQGLILLNYIVNYLVAIFLFLSISFSLNLKIFDRITGLDNFVNEVLKSVKDKDLVIADRIIFSNLSYKTRNLSNKIYMPYEQGQPITNHFQISSPLSKGRQEDFYLIGSNNDVSYLIKKNQVELVKEFNVPFSSNNIKLYEVVFK